MLAVGDRARAFAAAAVHAGFICRAAESLGDARRALARPGASWVVACGGVRLVELEAVLDPLRPRPRVAVIGRHVEPDVALDVLARGGAVIPYELGPRQFARFVQILAAARDYRSLAELFARANRLSPRETQVLVCALEGWGREEAADQIGCTPASVTTYWSRVCAKTGEVSQADVLLRVFHSAFDRSGGAR